MTKQQESQPRPERCFSVVRHSFDKDAGRGCDLFPTGVVLEGDNAAVLSTLPSDSVHLVCTSPPYGTLRTYDGKPEWNFSALRKELRRVLVDGGAVAWVIGDQVKQGGKQCIPEEHTLAFRNDGFLIHDIIIYAKMGCPTRPRNNAHWNLHDRVIIASKGKPRTVNPARVPCALAGQQPGVGAQRQKDGGVSKRLHAADKVADTKPEGNVWEFMAGWPITTTDEFAYEHPALMPEPLAAKIINAFSVEGDIVLDPFCGAGTTPKVARLLKRRWCGIEISEQYAAMARRRAESASSLFDGDDR